MILNYTSSISVEQRKIVLQIAYAVANNEYFELLNWYLSLIEDTVLKSIEPYKIFAYFYGNISADEMLLLLKKSITKKDVNLCWTPKKLDRIVNYYHTIQLQALKHLLESVVTESAYYVAEADTCIFKIIKLLEKQFFFIKFMHDEYNKPLNVSGILWKELEVNSLELSIINNFFESNDLIPVNPHHVYNLQNTIWGVISSNQLVVTNDLNYRALSNSKKDSHHSLFCPLEIKSEKIDSYLWDYTDFIEAVSAFSYKWYTTTYWFIHKIVVWPNQFPIQLESPIMMIDNEIMSLTSQYLDAVLKFEEDFLFNHDLRHHLIPVYADHFIIHHPDAPISYGGFRQQYINFATQMRQSKEDYEIWLWICQRIMLQEMFFCDPDLKINQIDLFKSYILNLKNLYLEQGSVFDISNMIDHLLVNWINRFLTIFPYKFLLELDKEWQDLICNFAQQLGVWEINVWIPELTQLLFDVWIIKEQSSNISSQIKDYLNQSSLETQVLLIYALVDLGLLDWETYDPKYARLVGLSKYRWLSIIYPQRKELAGYTERINSQHIQFGNRFISPLTVLFEQYKVFMDESLIYNQRIYLRNQQQIVLKKLSNILIQTERLDIRKFCDKKIHDLLTHDYSDFSIPYMNTVSPSIMSILHECIHVFSITNKYLKAHKICVVKSKKKLLSKVMNLSN